MSDLVITRESHGYRASFEAMASPCEVLLETEEEPEAREVATAVRDEVRRIEQKYSRYRNDNIIHRLNTASGAIVEVDDETLRLLDFADELFDMSDGLFDVTSGVLRRVWRFDGSNVVPSQVQIDEVLELVGFDKVERTEQGVRMQEGMELDFGGIGKEYAVDRCVAIARSKTRESVLVNLGGDLAVTSPRRNGDAWRVGQVGVEDRMLELRHGAIATSGDRYRFIESGGVRYSHIIDPRTGWPVAGERRSVSVHAGTCVEAGMLTTLALLHGDHLIEFLDRQGVRYWLSG